jgi:hypothetical protein
MSDQYIDLLEEGLKLAPAENHKPHLEWRSTSPAEREERMIRLVRARANDPRYESVKITSDGLIISLTK